jgi:hypothetical protein
MKKRILFISGVGVLVLGIGLALFFLLTDRSQKITFQACETAGGVAWRVDLYHPDICPACEEFRACEEKYLDDKVEDLREVCPQVTDCSECMQVNFPYPEKCPDGREKIGEISDAAIWWQCCR